MDNIKWKQDDVRTSDAGKVWGQLGWYSPVALIAFHRSRPCGPVNDGSWFTACVPCCVNVIRVTTPYLVYFCLSPLLCLCVAESPVSAEYGVSGAFRLRKAWNNVSVRQIGCRGVDKGKALQSNVCMNFWNTKSITDYGQFHWQLLILTSY